MSAKQKSETAIWQAGTIVCISRLADRGLAMARAMGIGELLGPLRVGQLTRIKLDDDRALAPTMVTRIESIRSDVVRIDTQNHRYEIRRIHGAPSTAGLLAIHDDSNASPAQHDRNETQIVKVHDWPSPNRDEFVSGARVKITQERDGAQRELGEAILLADLVPGNIASFAPSSGVMGTSEILEIVHIEKRKLELVTANSKYRLELISASGSA